MNRAFGFLASSAFACEMTRRLRVFIADDERPARAFQNRRCERLILSLRVREQDAGEDHAGRLHWKTIFGSPASNENTHWPASLNGGLLRSTGRY